jgi:hypothetical protein
MKTLSLKLQLLHGVPRCFVFCTGRSLWLSSLALVGAGSPLIVQPTLLKPLSPGDITEALHLTRSLLGGVAVAPALVEYFSSRVQALTGGVGRAVQYLLRERQRAVLGGAPVLTSREEVRKALERLMPLLPDISGMLLRVKWDGPAEEDRAKEIPAWSHRHEE